MNNQTIEEWMQQLHNNGYRQTPARRTIVEILLASPRAMEPLEIFTTGRQLHANLGLVTVYRTLEKLEELGLIQRVHQQQGCQAFQRTGQGHLPLLLCEVCGRGVLFEGNDLIVFFAKISQQTGFEIKGHWLQLSGVCAECK